MIRLVCCIVIAVCTLLAQTAEITTTETAVTFRSGTNLVPVTVVVRDSRGNTLGNLSIGDFQLFDNGKPQMISKFSIEKLTPNPKPAVAEKAKPAPEAAPNAIAEANSDGIPDRFVAYLFDDLHMSLQDLVNTRNAAKRQMDSQLQPLTRVAVYTTSGRQMQEFTADRDKLHATLDAMGAGAAMAANAARENTCPPVDYYMGDRIYNKRDLTSWKIATKDALFCANSTLGIDPSTDVQESDVSNCDFSGSSDGICKAAKFAREAAHTAVMAGDRDTEASLEMLRAVVSRMNAMPGQRNVVLISNGFLVLDDRRDEQMALIDRAIKSKVVIGGLDARGLYSQIEGGDASARINPNAIVFKSPYEATSVMMQNDVIATVAQGTGGVFYQGTNDYDEGFKRVAATPDFIYVLAYSPVDMKPDGKFHTLKVTLPGHPGVELQVRKGYFAPKTSGDPAAQAKQQIEDTFFSHDEIHELPAVLQTQYFKTDDGDATLSALAKVDVKKLAFRKDGDRNRNDLTVITGLFDNDGNFVSGAKKVVEMRLLDDTLAKRAASGISVKSSFAVHPGRYVVRMVVRDSEGQLMSAQSSLVEIP